MRRGIAAAAALTTAASAALLGGSAALLRTGMRRRRNDRTMEDILATPNRPYSVYASEIRRGAAWFDAQETAEETIRSFDGLRLVGRYLPAQGTRRGRLLLFHGFRSLGTVDFSGVLEYYHSLGYEILLVDQRSHGRSEGKYIAYGVLERFDCRDWAVYMNEKYGADVPTFLSGVSMGASTVLMAAGLTLPENVRGVIADCGFSSAWKELKRVLKKTYHLPAFPLLYTSRLLCRAVAGFDFKACSAESELRKTKLPVLLVHGEADDFVPYEMARENYAACGGERTLISVPGAGHGVSYMVDTPRCRKAVTDFLERHS